MQARPGNVEADQKSFRNAVTSPRTKPAVSGQYHAYHSGITTAAALSASRVQWFTLSISLTAVPRADHLCHSHGFLANLSTCHSYEH